MDIPAAYTRNADWVEQLIRGTTPDHLGAPTPCSEWSGRDLVDHLIDGAHRFAATLRRQPVPDAGDQDLLGDDPAASYRVAADSVIEAMNEPENLEGTVVTPFGEMPATVFCGIATLDHAAHGWDLARCTGQDPTIPQEVLDVVDPFARQALADTPRSPQSFLDPVEVPDSASPTDRYVAFLGRTP